MVRVRCKLCGEVKPAEDVKFFNGQSVCKSCIGGKIRGVNKND